MEVALPFVFTTVSLAEGSKIAVMTTDYVEKIIPGCFLVPPIQVRLPHFVIRVCLEISLTLTPCPIFLRLWSFSS